MGTSSAPVVTTLYRALLRLVKKDRVQFAWYTLAQEETHRLCGLESAESLPKHDLATVEGACATLRWAFKSQSSLKPNSRAAEDAIDRGCDAFRLCNLLHQADQRRAAHIDRTGVAFSLGMVVCHRKFGYRGVIYGWDRVCLRTEEWKQKFRVDHLFQGGNQPFYYVLPIESPNLSNHKYVAQENLELLDWPDTDLNKNKLLARLFKEYNESLKRFIPVYYLRYMFPDIYTVIKEETSRSEENQTLTRSQDMETWETEGEAPGHSGGGGGGGSGVSAAMLKGDEEHEESAERLAVPRRQSTDEREGQPRGPGDGRLSLRSLFERIIGHFS